MTHPQSREEELLDRIDEQKRYIAALEKQVESLEKKCSELEVSLENESRKNEEIVESLPDEDPIKNESYDSYVYKKTIDKHYREKFNDIADESDVFH